MSVSLSGFQSTPSGGKATQTGSINLYVGAVSIHAFRGEGDRRHLLCRPIGFGFQSTPSGGKATHLGIQTPWRKHGFNPRLPGGRRLPDVARFAIIMEFQSTPSGGKATGVSVRTNRRSGVSIHAFRGEGDRRAPRRCRCAASFNPRLPGGRRPTVGTRSTKSSVFQSTPSGGKATR